MLPTQCVVPDLSVVRFEGPQTLDFLQSQFTNDLLTQTPDQARLNGYCSAKGRLMASMLVIHHSPEQVDLVVSSNLAQAFLKRLSMFVLRTKTRGQLLDSPVSANLTAGSLPSAGQLTVSRQAAGISVALPDVQHPSLGLVHRYLVIGAPSQTDSQAMVLFKELEVLSAVPRIEQASMDLFVPQAINLELLGAVDFKKGCYPGQEVVARSQYLGKMKRRMRLGWVNQADLSFSSHTEPGQWVGKDITDHQGQIDGLVVMAALSHDNQRLWLLMETTHDLFDMQANNPTDLRLEQAVIHHWPLPYAIPVHEPVARIKL
jgi:tRNA-modifying protein YgfZ